MLVAKFLSDEAVTTPPLVSGNTGRRKRIFGDDNAFKSTLTERGTNLRC